MACRQGNLHRCSLLLALAPLLALPAGVALPAEPKDKPSRENELSGYRKTAEDLYNATSADAHTFERALADPEVRKEIERVFKRKLSDQQLHGMAIQAKLEAGYWSRYLEGLDRIGQLERRIPGQAPPPEPGE